MSKYPLSPRPDATTKDEIGRDGIIKAGQAIRDGVTDHEYWPQVDWIGEPGVTNLPHRTPPRKDKITAPYASCPFLMSTDLVY